MSMKGYGRLIKGFGDLKMGIVAVNVDIQNTKLEKIFHALVICSDCTLFYAKSP